MCSKPSVECLNTVQWFYFLRNLEILHKEKARLSQDTLIKHSLYACILFTLIPSIAVYYIPYKVTKQTSMKNSETKMKSWKIFTLAVSKITSVAQIIRSVIAKTIYWLHYQHQIGTMIYRKSNRYMLLFRSTCSCTLKMHRSSDLQCCYYC